MMSRRKASFIHLALSAVIAVAAIALILLLWYPSPFFTALGGQRVLLIVLGAHLTLGPLITLIIFDAKKSRRALLFDFSIIAILQASALIYGMSTMFQARPVFAVFSGNSFDLITANMLSYEDIVKAKHPAYRSLPLTGPVYVYAEMPTDGKERNALVMSALSGKDLPQFPQYYEPYANHIPAIASAAKPIAELRKLNPERVTEIENAISAIGQPEAELGFLPLRVKSQGMAIIIRKTDGKLLATLPLLPW